MRSLAALATMLALGSCSDTLAPAGQLLLYVDTDTILPPAPGKTSADAPLFDRLRVEVLVGPDHVACDGCTREFSLDHDTVFSGRASFAIENVSMRSAVARLRLYRTTGGFVVEPRPSSTLEAVVRLPIVGAEGITRLHVELRTSELGVPQGTLDAPIDAEPGPAKGGLAGTFERDRRVGCHGAPNDGEACAEGGAYWMGDPTNEGFPSERLVVLSPFFVTDHEVTVSELRASGLAKPGDPGEGHQSQCSFTLGPSPNDSLPVNCVSRDLASRYCGLTGGALVSEAQWEFLARGRRSSAYVWGDDDPRCDDAIYSRASKTDACGALGVGPKSAGGGGRDRHGDVVDLAGNVSEWVADEWAEMDEPCWSSPVLIDPVCKQPSTRGAPQLDFRGGNFAGIGALLHGAYRQHAVASGRAYSETVGFRCARPALP